MWNSIFPSDTSWETGHEGESTHPPPFPKGIMGKLGVHSRRILRFSLMRIHILFTTEAKMCSRAGWPIGGGLYG